MKAYAKNIIVTPVYPEKPANGALILTVKEEKPLHWEVISVGNLIDDISEGDKLLIKNYGMMEVMFEGEKYFIITQDQIFAKIM